MDVSSTRDKRRRSDLDLFVIALVAEGISTPYSLKTVSSIQGVKANVLFFDRKVASEKPWTKTLWIYDLRTNVRFTLKTNRLRAAKTSTTLSHATRPASGTNARRLSRFHAFTYDELIRRDKASLDIFWLKDESLEDAANLPAPDVIAAEIVEDLQAALDEFALIAEDLRKT
jgi:type I restriction enzyme M protein